MKVSKEPGGLQLRRWLKANGHTDDWLAGELKVTRNYVVALKQGRFEPSLGKAAMIEQLTNGEITAVSLVRPARLITAERGPYTKVAV
jgi:transcriptional regulator with XRE-family HTH domain